MALPSGYKRLEYIQSSGTQRINTRFKPNNNSRVITDAEILSSNAGTDHHIGSVLSNSQYWTMRLKSDRSGYAARYDGRTLTNVAHTGDVFARHVFDQNKNVVQIDNASATAFTAATWNATANLPLFCYSGNGTSFTGYISMKLYSCRIYDDGALVRDFIPCQTADGEIGLWDDVNSVFYGNAGTGSFTAGPVVAIAADASEITELEYIQSSGGPYIDTVFKPNQDTRVVCDTVFPVSVTAYWLFGARNGNQDRTFGFLTYDSQYRSDFNTSTDEYLTGSQSGRFTVDKDGNVTKINGETAKTATAGTFQCGHSLYLFANNNNGSASGQCEATMYSCQIYDNGTQILNYIAAKLSDGTVGFYDKLHGLLYINVGTGSFTSGPEVKKAPQAPTGFFASSLTDTAVQLIWTASDGATGYQLYKAGDLLATLTDTGYTDTVEPFSGNTYSVTAFNDDGESEAATLIYQAIPDNPILYLVTDRTAADVTGRNEKGTYRSADLNRVGFAVQYLADYLDRHGITVSVSPKLDWTDTDHPTPSEMRIYLNDILTLRAALKLPKDTATVPEDMVNLTYQEANDIESILVVLDEVIGKMISVVDAGWTGGMAYTGFYFKEATA